MMKRTGRLAVLLAFMLLFAAQGALACPVCYGKSDSSTAEGLNLAILTLLGVTGGVLSGVVAFFLYMRRRSKITLNETVDLPSVH